MLIWFRGGIFQQVKQAKVYSFIITALSCPKLREAGHQRKTKKGKTLYWETPREDHAFSFEKGILKDLFRFFSNDRMTSQYVITN